MPGIEDLMNIRTQGGTANAPPMGGPPPGMGGPPPGMGGPPPGMGGPPPGMGGDPMMAGAQGMSPTDKAAEPDIDNDSAMLAEAVVNRTGNIQTAVVVLDNAKALLIASANEQSSPGMGGPPPGMGGGDPGMGGDPMMAAYGRPLMRRGGGPLYRNEGGGMADSDVLRQMIMDNLQKPEIQEQAMSNVMGQSGRTMSDRDFIRDSGKDKALSALMAYRQTGN